MTLVRYSSNISLIDSNIQEIPLRSGLGDRKGEGDDEGKGEDRESVLRYNGPPGYG